MFTWMLTGLIIWTVITFLAVGLSNAYKINFCNLFVFGLFCGPLATITAASCWIIVSICKLFEYILDLRNCKSFVRVLKKRLKVLTNFFEKN